MAKQTPKQLVSAKFGDKSSLVSAIVSLTNGDDATRSALMGTTNKKLLRIHAVTDSVQKQYGGKSGLIDAIAKLQFVNGAANDGWREKVDGFTVKRLLDLHRQLSTTGAGVKR